MFQHSGGVVPWSGVVGRPVARLDRAGCQRWGPRDLEGTVQFEARYRGGVLKETSLFQRRDGADDGLWLYVGALHLDG